MRLHYFYRIPYAQAIEHPSEIVSFAAQQPIHRGTPLSGRTMTMDLRFADAILNQTDGTGPPDEQNFAGFGYGQEYAMPLTDSDGHVEVVVLVDVSSTKTMNLSIHSPACLWR